MWTFFKLLCYLGWKLSGMGMLIKYYNIKLLFVILNFYTHKLHLYVILYHFYIIIIPHNVIFYQGWESYFVKVSSYSYSFFHWKVTIVTVKSYRFWKITCYSYSYSKSNESLLFSYFFAMIVYYYVKGKIKTKYYFTKFNKSFY